MVFPSMGECTMAGPDDDVRVDIDLGEAEREAERIRAWLVALRRRHDLARFEYTRHVRIVPAGPTYSHPILTLGTRFTETEDLLLSTYLHEQMHWYLWLLGGPDHDPVTPFFDELVRRYPKAPIWLPEGARSYEQTYVHLVVCWLEVEAAAELIGRERANRIVDTQWGYRWIYRTVIADRDPLGELLTTHGLFPMTPAPELIAIEAERRRAELDGDGDGDGDGDEAEPTRRASRRRTSRAAPGSQPRPGRGRSRERGGRSSG
jgi:hypothetical protein